MYTDTVGRELGVTPQQEERLRDWEVRYQRDLQRMGPDAVDRAPLREQRDRELQGILTPDQYQRWNELDVARSGRTDPTGGAPGPQMREVGTPAGQQPTEGGDRNKATRPTP